MNRTGSGPFLSLPCQTHPSGDICIAWPKQGDGADRFLELHAAFLHRSREGPVDVLFIGDSITEQWVTASDVWCEHYEEYQPANFGISGDGAQHILWRIEHGELTGLCPRVTVLLAGTNNSRTSSGSEIATAMKKIVGRIRSDLPVTQVLLLAIFPRGPGINADGTTDDGVARMKVIREANEQLARMENGTTVRFLDIGACFLDEAGRIRIALMPDQLHLSAAGYRVWAEAMRPLLHTMLNASTPGSG